ncbi:MAG: hypothetical protein NVS3B16_06870 [Vulcanimicrobiaceae bacterium]
MSLAAFFVCLAFGVALILNIQEADEGVWFWYAKLLRSGQHLYANLDLALQPLFPLETALFQRAFGESWLASKIPAALHLVLFALGIYLLALRDRWKDRQMAVVICGIFFFGIHFEAYRFDDYHVSADAAALFSALLILDLARASDRQRHVIIAAVLGAIAAVTFLTRANDGGLLFLYDAAVIVLIGARGKWYVSLLALGTTFALVSLGLLASTGDSLTDWAAKSLLHASAAKGGTNELLNDPASMIATSWTQLWSGGGFAVVLETAVAVAAWIFLVAPFSWQRRGISVAKLAIGLAIVGAVSLYIFQNANAGEPDKTFLAFGTILTYGVGSIVIVRALVHLVAPDTWTWRESELVVALPLVLNVSGSLSSAGFFADSYFSIAFFFLLLPAARLFAMNGRVRSAYVLFAALLAGTSAWYRYNDPSSWINYKTFPLFVNREIVTHPVYGPMVIDTRLLGFISRVCPLVNDGDPHPQLLSIPWNYPNYFCAVAPWQNYVQTWYDTTPLALMNRLLDRLTSEPPKWIVYQRQPEVLAIHEAIYNQGRRLPQRTLDELIMSRLAEGRWTVAYRYQDPNPSNEWIVIRTRTSHSEGEDPLAGNGAQRTPPAWRTVERPPTWTVGPNETFTVRYAQATPAESIRSRAVSFARDGVASISARIAAANVVTDGGYGYTVDLYDVTTDTVVGSLGYRAVADVSRRYSFTARVLAAHRYQLRLRYQAASGTATFSDVDVASVGGTFSGAWSVTPSAPVWQIDPRNGTFTVTHDGSPAGSTLARAVVFRRNGPAHVAARVAVASPVATGSEYGFDLYDGTTKSIAGAFDVPAHPGNGDYAFVANVKPSHTYFLRLLTNAGRARVTFSHLRIRYGAED